MGFSRQEYWNGLPFPPPGDLPDPGIKLWCLLGRRILCPCATREGPRLFLKFQLIMAVLRLPCCVLAFSGCNTNSERDNSSSSLTARTTGTPHIYQMETRENSSCLLPSKIGGLFWKISQIINHYSHCNMLSYFANVCPGARIKWSKREIIFP